MSEEFEDIETTEDEDTSQSLWEMLKIDDPGEEPYEELQEEQDKQVAADDKVAKKLAAKMDKMESKFQQTMMQERIKAFQKDASEVAQGLFKTVAGDVKDLETLDKAIELVRQREAKLVEETEKYKAKLEEDAARRVASAWGTSPTGAPRQRDDEEERMKKIAAGDTHALLMDLLEGNLPA